MKGAKEKGVERRGRKQKYVEAKGLEAMAYKREGWYGSPSGRGRVRARTWAINGSINRCVEIDGDRL